LGSSLNPKYLSTFHVSLPASRFCELSKLARKFGKCVL